MATEAVTPVVNIEKSRSTYCLVKKMNEKGEEEVQFTTESAAQKLVEEKKGEILASQSFIVPSALTAAGISEICPAEKEAAKLFNRGVDNKAYQKIRATMLEQNEDGQYCFQAKEGDWDLSEFIAQETGGRGQSTEQKLEKILDGVDEATAAALLAKLMAKLQGTAEQTA